VRVLGLICDAAGLAGCLVMVTRTVALMIVRRVLGVLGWGQTPDADAVEIAVLRHQLGVLPGRWPGRGTRRRIGCCWPRWPGCYHTSGGRRFW
jgi:hypothetical protein